MVLKRRLLPLGHLNASNLTNNIMKFYGNYTVVKVAQYKTQQELEASVSKSKKGIC